MIATMATFIIGVVIGYLGQRSRFCIVSGIRDLYILKDSYRIRGLLGLIIGGVLGFTAFKFMGGNLPSFPSPFQIDTSLYLIVIVIGGVGIGFFSILAEGCPFRQHVIAAEGRESAILYLVGFYIGIVYFVVVTRKLLELMLIGIG